MRGDFNPDKPYTIIRSSERIEQIKSGVVLALAPPLGVLVLGLAFAWVARGFRQEQPKI
jgi:hypothetical protein